MVEIPFPKRQPHCQLHIGRQREDGIRVRERSDLAEWCLFYASCTYINAECKPTFITMKWRAGQSSYFLSCCSDHSLSLLGGYLYPPSICSQAFQSYTKIIPIDGFINVSPFWLTFVRQILTHSSMNFPAEELTVESAFFICFPRWNKHGRNKSRGLECSSF